jgi:hypothetical protein
LTGIPEGVPTTPPNIHGRIGRIAMKPLEAEFPNTAVTAHYHWAKLQLTCAGGRAEAKCDAKIHLTSPSKRGAPGPRQSRHTTEIVLARGHFTVPSESTRWVSIRLTSQALDILEHRPWLRVEASAAVKGGQVTTRELFLQR